MENPTAFDLNRQILAWREHLGQSPAFQPENLEELETHLRDSIATLQARGLSAEESYMIATRRVGADGALAAEYGKVNRQEVWLQRILWMLVGLQLWTVVNDFSDALARTFSTLVLGQWLRSQWLQGDASHHVAVGTSFYAGTQLLALAGSLVIGWWLVAYQWPRLTRWAGRWSRGYRLFYLAALLLLAFVLQGGLGVLSVALVMKILPEGAHADVLQSQGQWGYILVSAGHAVMLLIVTLWLARQRIGPQPDFMDIAMPGGNKNTIIHGLGIDLAGEMSAVIAELQAAGLSAAEAFMVARHRANGGPSPALSSGSGHPLAAGWERAFWMLVGLQLWGLINLNLRLLTGWVASFAIPTASHLLNRDQSSPGFNVAIPVAAFGLVQILSLGGSLALCWWLTLRRGPHISAWLNQLRSHQNWLAGTGVMLLVLLAEICPRLAPVFNPLMPSHHDLPLQVEIFSAAIILNALGHAATLIILTFMVARKQLKFSGPA